MSGHLRAKQIALFAGGELPWFDRFQAGRHLRSCESCADELRSFEEAREILRSDVEELPADLNWNRLAAEMKANIHLGLEAGEIAAGRMTAAARADEEETESYGSFFKPMAALASVAVFLYGATWVLSTRPKGDVLASQQVLLTTTEDGISYQGYGSALTLIHEGSKPVALKVGMTSGLRAQYVDEETGQVTINHVYSE